MACAECATGPLFGRPIGHMVCSARHVSFSKAMMALLVLLGMMSATGDSTPGENYAQKTPLSHLLVGACQQHLVH